MNLGRPFLGLLFLLAAGATFAEPGKPNVLLISIDTLRADSLGAYGCPKNTSPAIDKFAAEGTLFEYAIAQKGSTWPSLMSIQTSLYPAQHGLRKNGGVPNKNITQLAQILSNEGYECKAYLSNANEGEWNGFDEVVGFKQNKSLHRSGKVRPMPNYRRETGVPGIQRDIRVTELGVDYLNGAGERPFFLWLHYIMPHRAYVIPEQYEAYQSLFVDPDYKGKLDGSDAALYPVEARDLELPQADLDHVRNLYYQCVRVDDDLVRQVLAQLESSGLADETLVILTADHGEDIYERARYFGHSASIHEGVLRVPLIVRYPAKVPAGKRVAEVVELIDIAPTILDILGVPIPKAFQGESLMPAMRGEPVDLGPAFSEWEDKITAIRTNRHRLVLNPLNHHPRTMTLKNLKAVGVDEDTCYVIEEEELFQLPEDMDELNNLAPSKPELVNTLREQLVRWQEETGWVLNGAEDIEIGDELKEELEALGYVL